MLPEITMTNRDNECLFVKVDLNDRKVNVGVLYRTPDANVHKFTEHVSKIMEKLTAHNRPCYLQGDYNIDLFKHNVHIPTSEFLDTMFSNSFMPLINKPTRETSTAATIIDNIFTNQFRGDKNTFTGILTTDIFYHHPIFHIVQCKDKPHHESHQLI